MDSDAALLDRRFFDDFAGATTGTACNDACSASHAHMVGSCAATQRHKQSNTGSFRPSNQRRGISILSAWFNQDGADNAGLHAAVLNGAYLRESRLHVINYDSKQLRDER
jgi:hypothetical protein